MVIDQRPLIRSCFTICLGLQSSDDPEKELRDRLIAVFLRLQEADDSFSVLRWHMADTSTWTPITQPKCLPTRVGELRKYFVRATPRNNGGQIFSPVVLEYTKDFIVVMQEVGWWFQSNDASVFLNKIQCKKMMWIAWGLYSVQSIDLEVLRDALSDRTGFEFGLLWRPVDTGHNSTLTEEQKVRALHFEVSHHHRHLALDVLFKAYGNRTDFPLGIKMRIIATNDSCPGRRTKEKNQKPHCPAKNHLAFMVKIQCWDITNWILTLPACLFVSAIWLRISNHLPLKLMAALSRYFIQLI